MRQSGDIIGQLLGGLLNPQATQRVQHALGNNGLGAGDNPLAGVLGQLQGGRTTSGASGPLGGLAEMAKSFLGQGQPSPAAADGADAGASAIAGMLMGNSQGATRSGALALLGSLAASALSQSGKAAAPTRTDDLPGAMNAIKVDPEQDPALAQRADLLLLAMVNAAKADGRVDHAELERIKGKVAEGGIDQAEVEQLGQMLNGPMDIDGLTAQVDDAQLAAEVYAASALAIEIDTDIERQYLETLASRLALDAGTVKSLHAMIGVA